MAIRYILCIIFRCKCSFPYKLCDKITFSKNLITYLLQILNLIVINRDEYHTILGQKVPCHFQSWINHIQPIGMKSTVALGVRHQTVALLVKLS